MTIDPSRAQGSNARGGTTDFKGRVGEGIYLNPKSMYNNSPKPMIAAIKAIILHTFGVQVCRLLRGFDPQLGIGSLGPEHSRCGSF